MPTNYPTSLDNFTNPTANDSLNLPSHSTQHANANDAIEAIEAKLGLGANVMPYAFSAGSVAVTATGSSQAYTVTLPVGRFSVTPILSLAGNVGRGICNFVFASSSASSIVLTVATPVSGGASTGAGEIYWHAIQMTSGAASG